MSSFSRIDLPLTAYTADEPLGIAPYARALDEFVRSCETPLTIGVQGDWGIGKTTLLNMLRSRLENNTGASYPTIYFNTWQYAQLDREEHLTIALLGDLVHRIGRLPGLPAVDRAKARDILSMVGRMAVSAGAQVLASKVGIDGAQALRDGLGDDSDETDALPEVLRSVRLMVEYKERFTGLVTAALAGTPPGSRLVILIDDLDRIRPARALELLSAVKNFLDVPGCVFVLAVDYEVIQRGVAEALGASERKRHGKSYFDKIIQVPFNMPVASYRVDHYVMAMLGWTWSPAANRYDKAQGASNPLYFKYQQTVSADVASDLESLTHLTVGKNPRSIKRAANTFALLKLVFDQNDGTATAEKRKVGGEATWQDVYLRLLYGMACFQLAYPELFTLFVQEPTPTHLQRLKDTDTLRTLPQMRRIADRADDVEEEMSRVAGFFDQIISIVDYNEDGSVSADEFRPVLDVLKHARLTSARIEEAGDGFAKIRARVVESARSKGWSPDGVERTGRTVDVLQRSDWNDALYLRIHPAGKHIFNLRWAGRALGSFVSTKGNPVQIYLKDPSGDLAERLRACLPEDVQSTVSAAPPKHYGDGTVHLDVWKISERPDATDLLNRAIAEITML